MTALTHNPFPCGALVQFAEGPRGKKFAFCTCGIDGNINYEQVVSVDDDMVGMVVGHTEGLFPAAIVLIGQQTFLIYHASLSPVK